MIWSLIVGIVAGLLTRFVKPVIEPIISKSDAGISKDEIGMLTFGLVLLVGAVLAWEGSPVALVLGGILGVFGSRLLDAARSGQADE